MEGGCGCQARKNWLNDQVPGMGDLVGSVADPVYERWQKMPELLRPDLKSVVWLAIGAFVVPFVLKKVR